MLVFVIYIRITSFICFLNLLRYTQDMIPKEYFTIFYIYIYIYMCIGTVTRLGRSFISPLRDIPYIYMYIYIYIYMYI